MSNAKVPYGLLARGRAAALALLSATLLTPPPPARADDLRPIFTQPGFTTYYGGSMAQTLSERRANLVATQKLLRLVERVGSLNISNIPENLPVDAKVQVALRLMSATGNSGKGGPAFLPLENALREIFSNRLPFSRLLPAADGKGFGLTPGVVYLPSASPEALERMENLPPEVTATQLTIDNHEVGHGFMLRFGQGSVQGVQPVFGLQAINLSIRKEDEPDFLVLPFLRAQLKDDAKAAQYFERFLRYRQASARLWDATYSHFSCEGLADDIRARAWRLPVPDFESDESLTRLADAVADAVAGLPDLVQEAPPTLAAGRHGDQAVVGAGAVRLLVPATSTEDYANARNAMRGYSRALAAAGYGAEQQLVAAYRGMVEEQGVAPEVVRQVIEDYVYTEAWAYMGKGEMPRMRLERGESLPYDIAQGIARGGR